MPSLTKTKAVAAAVATTSSGKKRKMDADAEKFYAVRAGKKPGVYTTWADCQQHTAGFKGAQYKSFTSRKDAEDFVAGKNPKTADAKGKVADKYYAVAVGRDPGVYTDWADASKAIVGWKAPKYKKFETRNEAIEFIRTYGDEAGQKSVENERDQPPSKRRKAELDDDSDGILKVWTDGSSRRNGRQGALAGVGVYFGDNDPRNVSEPLLGDQQTNQRAELTAILRALQKVSVDQDVRIHTDSKYSIDCVTNWYRGWQEREWTTTEGKPVVNKDVVQAVRVKIADREASGSKTLFQWVKGHSAQVGNDAADKLANEGALKRRTGK